MTRVRVELPDRVPGHAGPPQRMARQIGVPPVAEDLAVDLQICAGPAFLAPQRVLAERAVLRFEIYVPQRGRLDHVAVAVEHREVLRRHPLPRRKSSAHSLRYKLNQSSVCCQASLAAASSYRGV